MKKIISDIKYQKILFPIAFIIIFIVWILTEKGMHYWWQTPLLIAGILCFILDRIFKPWKRERLMKKGIIEKDT